MAIGLSLNAQTESRTHASKLDTLKTLLPCMEHALSLRFTTCPCKTRAPAVLTSADSSMHLLSRSCQMSQWIGRVAIATVISTENCSCPASKFPASYTHLARHSTCEVIPNPSVMYVGALGHLSAVRVRHASEVWIASLADCVVSVLGTGKFGSRDDRGRTISVFQSEDM